MISLIRVDDRLIHGQVMAVWVRLLSINRILVADDEAAADAFSRQIMQLAMPSSTLLSVTPIDEAASQLPTIETDPSHTLVLLRTVAAAAQLHLRYAYRTLNIGGIGMAPGRKPLWRSIAASASEVEMLSQLRRDGVDVYLQMIPSDVKKRIAGP